MSREFRRDIPDPGGVQKVCAKKFPLIFRSLKEKLGGRFGFFFCFFSLGEGKGESEAPGREGASF